MMRVILVVLFSLVFWTIDSNAQSMHDLNKVKAFMSKTPKCHLAIATRIGVNQPKVLDDVLCVTDLEVGKGTINERSGCTLSYYKPSKGTFNRLHSSRGFDYRGFMPVAKGKSCTKGGFEALLEMNAYELQGEVWEGDKRTPPKYAKVKDVLRYFSDGHDLEKKIRQRQVLIYAHGNKYKNWWDSKK